MNRVAGVVLSPITIVEYHIEDYKRPDRLHQSTLIRFTRASIFPAEGVQAGRVGQTKSGAKRQHIKGREDGRKEDGACGGRPRLEGLEVERYAALAFLTAVGFAGFGCAFAAVFLTACAFSFAANSAFTFWAMASVSTL